MTDNGCGMTPDVLEHIFEPFFTTKDTGKGTGLGLSTVFGIVKQSEGHIAVYSEPGRGSTFKVYLPRVDSPVEPVRPSDPFDVPGGSETILVVEDEEALRHLAGRLLERHGYRVLSAANAPEALEVARRHAGPIDLLLTDIVMPGMSGPELATTLQTVRPGVPVVFTSGYTEEAVSRLGAVDSGNGYLGKPFTSQALLNVVRDLLDRRIAAEALDRRATASAAGEDAGD